MYYISLILISLIFDKVSGTLTPDGTVSIDCGDTQTFTCSLASGSTTGWSISGFMPEIAATGSTGAAVAAASTRVTSISGAVSISSITISGFTSSDYGGTVQCVNITGAPSVVGTATIAVALAPVDNVTAIVDQCSARLTWSEPGPADPADPAVTTSVTCNPPSSQCSSCTSSGCTIGGLTPSIMYTFHVTRNRTGCNDSTAMSTTIMTRGLPECGEFEVTTSCGLNFNSTGSVVPTYVNVLYVLSSDPSIMVEKRCRYTTQLEDCQVKLPRAGIYNTTVVPENDCGPANGCMAQAVSMTDSDVCVVIPDEEGTLPPGAYAGIAVAGVVVLGVGFAAGYCLAIFIMSLTCFGPIGFVGLLMCRCCRSSGKSNSTVPSEPLKESPPPPPVVEPPQEYADPQAIRDRKKEERMDRVEYTAVEFSKGAGSGVDDDDDDGETAIRRKQDTVIYTDVQVQPTATATT